MRADAFDHAAAKVFLDAFERAGRQDLQEGRPELQAVLAVSVPPAAGLDELPRLDRGGRPENGHEVSVPPHLHPKNAETRLRAVEGDPFHQAGQGFAIMGGTVGDRVIHDAQSSTVDTAMPVGASGEASMTGESRYTVEA